jgi:hypothetical protein
VGCATKVQTRVVAGSLPTWNLETNFFFFMPSLSLAYHTLLLLQPSGKQGAHLVARHLVAYRPTPNVDGRRMIMGRWGSGGLVMNRVLTESSISYHTRILS